MTPTEFDSALTDGMTHIKAVFGEEVLYAPATGRAFAITGIFDAAHAVIDTSGQVPHEAIKPVLGLAWADLRAAGRPAPKRQDSVTIRGKRYTVVEVQDDGHAEVRLILALGVSRA